MEEKYEYLVRGALLKCSCGSHKRRMNLPTCHGVYIGDNPVVNSGDYKTESNISSFGVCSSARSGEIGEEKITLVVEPTAENPKGGEVSGRVCRAKFAGTEPWKNANKKVIVGDEGCHALTTNSYLECIYGGRITAETSGQEYEMKEKEKAKRKASFELPKEERDKIEKILASEGKLYDKKVKGKVIFGKLSQIKHIYENYLYKLAQADFDNYAQERAKNKLEADMDLVSKLKGKVDIRAVGKALSDDVLRAMPKNEGKIVNKLYTFHETVNTGRPMDLKTHELSDAIGNLSHNFSIWARPWEDNTRKYNYYVSTDYMGNFTYGYLGASYFEGLDFDDYDTVLTMAGVGLGAVASSGNMERTKGEVLGATMGMIKGGELGSVIGAVLGAILGGSLTGAVVGGTAAKTPDRLRKSNPDKTDAQMMLLSAAGVAQFRYDLGNDEKDPVEDTKKFVGSLIKGNWGDNENDSKYIIDGTEYYYETNGIDKKEMIRKERQ